MADADSEFWRFSLKFYAQPGVPEACLTLQDTHGVDVNVLLFLIFLASQGRQVNVDDVRRIDALIANWRKQVVQPLRTLRRALKAGIAPIPAQAAESIRVAIKRQELAAEKLQQESLENAFAVGQTGALSTSNQAFSHNMAAYQEMLSTFDTHCVVILRGVFEKLMGSTRPAT